jgi:caffeoyl-CoA O-methyltransferase
VTDGPKSFLLSLEVHSYLVAHGMPPDRVQQALIDETRALGDVAQMQVAPEQGAFLTLLTGLVGAERAVEVGTFTGYSALCIARGLPEGGRLVCCEVNDEWAAIALSHWEEAGVASRIELRMGPALATLQAMPPEPTFDLAFIDADKEGYGDYYEAVLARLAPGGVMLVDNVLWGGRVVDPASGDDRTDVIRAFNDRVAADERVDCVMLPIADGLTLVRKRP